MGVGRREGGHSGSGPGPVMNCSSCLQENKLTKLEKNSTCADYSVEEIIKYCVGSTVCYDRGIAVTKYRHCLLNIMVTISSAFTWEQVYERIK